MENKIFDDDEDNDENDDDDDDDDYYDYDDDDYEGYYVIRLCMNTPKIRVVDELDTYNN